MNKLDKISLFISILCLWINTLFNEEFQLIIGFFFIFLVGILHGSNDIVLINKTYLKKKLSNTKIISFYVLVVLLGTFLFCFVPLIGLLLFILVSAYHFGEQHWEFLNQKKNILEIKLFQFFYGLMILLLLFQSHSEKVKGIIYSIIGFKIENIRFDIILLVAIILVVLFSIRFYLIIESFKNKILINIYYLIIFTIIFKTANLIWAFAIYFVIWHSIPSIRDQVKFIYGSVNKETITSYIKTAFPFWIASLFGIFFLFIFLSDFFMFETLFFSFLAAITFPHVLVIIQMFKNNN